MVDRVDTEDAGTLYLDVVDILARRGEQLQARSSLSESLGALGLEHVILFLSGGLAAGILERLGERALDQTLSKLAAVYRKFRSNGPREEASADKAAAAVAYITTVIRALRIFLPSGCRNSWNQFFVISAIRIRRPSFSHTR